MKRIVITGAAGIVGSAIRPFLRSDTEELVLTDLQPIKDLHSGERFQPLDVTEMREVEACVAQADAVIHLAGVVGPDYSFDDVLGPNIVGTYNVLEAARRVGVPNVVLASSHHAVGFYQRTEVIDQNALPRPDSFYGFSKACGESLGSLFADKYGLNVLVIRIGFVGEQAIDERRVHTWISPEDMAQLVRIGLNSTQLGFEIVYGVSSNPDCFFDNSNASRLGFTPQDHVIDHLASEDLLSREPDPGPDGIYVGGHFVSRKLEIFPEAEEKLGG